MATSSLRDSLKLEVVLVGDYSVGKTSLIRRINGKDLTNEDGSLSTASAPDFTKMDYRFRVSDTLIKNLEVRISDTGGMEREGKNLATSFLRNKDGVILTWDLSDTDTYRHLDEWEEIFSNVYRADNMPAIIVVANKSDKHLKTDNYTRCAEKYKKRKITCFKTSAKNGENVQEAFDKLVSLMVNTSLMREGTPGESKTEVVHLEASQVDHPAEGSKGSCC